MSAVQQWAQQFRDVLHADKGNAGSHRLLREESRTHCHQRLRQGGQAQAARSGDRFGLPKPRGT